ncbi:MAG TPA: hypothetical protein PLS90_10110 [Candidatus Sumerlaeota bacterium]|mgnify:CR=1 FL=1|nr:MAG: hypothetical protein BWZ08_02294 [candidate division BRC1 bacterium ADurb.BinA292]HOE96586.1 hypothetical protein [Candidatus Sumerlaeota bacterium]HOR27624.1 hypothetical protein [Candidatus Sumerlaeota bacterium]HPK02795.1 hypothetical protein [Candidatus Sumerlaeota bacterium]
MTESKPRAETQERYKDFLTLFSDGDLIMLPAFQLDNYLERLLDKDTGTDAFLNYRAFLMLEEERLALPPELLEPADEPRSDQAL